jgi:hypothetical protein
VKCDAKIRPMPDDTEVECVIIQHAQLNPYHSVQHHGDLINYAYPGSSTRISWFENDRRNFHGEWPGRCPLRGLLAPCVLPAGHRGECAA